MWTIYSEAHENALTLYDAARAEERRVVIAECADALAAYHAAVMAARAKGRALTAPLWDAMVVAQRAKDAAQAEFDFVTYEARRRIEAAWEEFLALPEEERQALNDAAAARLSTDPQPARPTDADREFVRVEKARIERGLGNQY